METILYRPIIINPLAYLTFPNISKPLKGYDAIEPANFSGILTITDSQGNSKQFLNTLEVDFSSFNGVVFVDNYTNQGSVRLGVWYID